MNRFQPTWNSLHGRKMPPWYDEAKLGIFIHWGLYSVPAFAPPVGELGAIPDTEWFICNPYAEWYYNSVNVGEGPTYQHHLKTYGKDFAYEQFADMWKAENWDPDAWAALFEAAGAKYVVLVTKHHDGFCLYPSRYTSYHALNRGPRRDIVGELAAAVRRRGLRFGCYYSGIIDWRFMHEPIYTDWDCRNLNCPTYEYADYAFKQWLELIDTYRPDILWNDIGWPYAGERQLPHLLAHYYNTCPDGVVNDRFNDLWHDFWCKEYQQGAVNREEKWEMTRGLGLSFGYNAEEGLEHILSPQQLTGLLSSTVGNNGNLLINVGPMADGTIPALQEQSLRGMGDWLRTNGQAIYATRPDEQASLAADGLLVHFTRSGARHFAIVEGLDEQERLIPGLRGAYRALDEAAGVRLHATEQGITVAAARANGFPVVLERLP